MTSASNLSFPTVARGFNASPRDREAQTARPSPRGEPTAEEQAARAVTRTDGGMLVLAAPGVPPVKLGPYPNPDVLRARLAAVRQFVAALIRSACPPTPHAESSPKRRQDGGFAADSDLHQMTDDGCPLSPDPTRWVDADWRDSPETEGTARVNDSALRPSDSPRPVDGNARPPGVPDPG